MTEWLTAAEAVRRIPAGARVFVQGGAAEPRTLIGAMADDPDCGDGCTFTQVSVPGVNRTDLALLHERARGLAFFGTPETAESLASGRTLLLPKQYHMLYRYLQDDHEVDVAVIQVGPQRADGCFPQGLGQDSLPAILPKARLVIAEVNRDMPLGAGTPPVPGSRIDIAVEVDAPPQEFRIGAVTDDVRAVAAEVEKLVRDGDCIQIGIGTLPVAVLQALRTRNDLGIHSGMLADGMPELVDGGNVNGRRKTIDTGLIVAGVPLGSRALMDWTVGRADLVCQPIGYTHDSALIGQIDNFVSINSGLEVDLFGQLNAETLKGRQISATGGSVDFMRGAARSRGGRSIVAMTATAAGGKLSRIVATIDPGNVVTGLRTDIDYVVTEYGAARLRNLPVSQRPGALIEIAAPAFRDGLRDAWREMTKGRWPG
ncbi:MAG: acetyl-CoA hydrolase/transferase C-terminal domain-containing protein [Pseudomonadota bacterium]|nr:acetyl-CoA hydrolase/transferase C-terminal domain-containing protein [Pseudomonadota bacterium]